MILNEARKYITFKSTSNVEETIKNYNYLYNSSFGNIKNNFSGLIGLIGSLNVEKSKE